MLFYNNYIITFYKSQDLFSFKFSRHIFLIFTLGFPIPYSPMYHATIWNSGANMNKKLKSGKALVGEDKS